MREKLIEDFKSEFPVIAKNAIRYQLDRKGYELIVTMGNGSKILYNMLDRSFRHLPDIDNMTDRDVKNEFGKRLRRIMEREGFTQEQLADEAGIQQSNLSLYINGKSMPNFYTADKIARALGCSLDDFRYLEV